MRIVVTGGTGFLGRHLVWRLTSAGHEVVFTGRNATAATQVIRQCPVKSTIPSFVYIAHGQPEAGGALIAAAAGADVVVHTAALSSPWGTHQDFEHGNVAATREVLTACEHQQIPTLIHISTPGLYFNFRDRMGVQEDEPLPPPVNLYAKTKGIAEQLVRSAKHLNSAVILRPRAIFGPHDCTLLPRLLRIARGGSLPLMRGGKAWLDLTYVDNVIDAIELALARSVHQSFNSTINISNGEPIQVCDLFVELQSAFQLSVRLRPVPYAAVAATAWAMENIARMRPGWEPPLTRYSAGLLAYSQTLNLTRAHRELGYMPKVTLREGLMRTAQWFGMREEQV